MSKKLSELLGADEPLFSISLQQLERATGNQSRDVVLTADIIIKSHQKMRELGLDPKFTNGRELYHALLGLVKLHDSFLAERLGIKNHADVQEVLKAIQTQSRKLPVYQSVWAIKTSVLRRLLKGVPPKKVMKALHYRSLESMLKRESPSEVLGGARFVENAEWHSKFTSQYNKLTPADFEQRGIEVIYFDPKKWNGAADEFIRNTRHTVSHLKEVGAVLLAPLPIQHMPGMTITTLPFVLHYMNEVRAYSAYFKSQQVQPNFGEMLAETIIHDPSSHAVMAGQQIHWRVLHRHFGSGSVVTDAFEPHITPEDFAWQSAERCLYKIEPALYFWYDMDYVGMHHDGNAVSFNLLDMAISLVNNLSYGYQSTQHMKSSLWHEILGRYLASPSLEQQVLNQFGRTANMVGSADFSGEIF